MRHYVSSVGLGFGPGMSPWPKRLQSHDVPRKAEGRAHLMVQVKWRVIVNMGFGFQLRVLLRGRVGLQLSPRRLQALNTQQCSFLPEGLSGGHKGGAGQD